MKNDDLIQLERKNEESNNTRGMCNSQDIRIK